MPRTAAGTSIATIGDLIDNAYRMVATCPSCGSRDVDLVKLAERYGRDASYIRGETPIRMKCALCGAAMPSFVIIPR